MAKLLNKDIEVSDLKEFLQTASDFASELKTLRSLIELGFKCEHSGTYDDPVTVASNLKCNTDIKSGLGKKHRWVV